MGVIQQGINQLIGTTARAVKLSPNFETNQELERLKNKDNALSQQLNAISQTKPQNLEETEVTQDEQNRIHNERLEVASNTFRLKPTEASFQALKDARKEVINARRSQANAVSLRETKQQRAQQRAQAQLEQQQRFNEFRDMFTEGGRYK